MTSAAHSDFHALASGVVLHAMHWEPSGPNRHRTWVLTHGLASNARLWDGVARRLADSGHRVVTVDQRGHGLSSKPDSGYDIPTCADDLAQLIEHLGLERPAVAGQSWGGNVVVELAHRHGHLVDQICCVDGGFIELQSSFDSWDDVRSSLAPPELEGTPVEQMQAWIERSATDWPDEGRAGTMHNFEIRSDGTIAPWLSFDRHLTVLRGLWEHHPFERFAGIDVPVLFIAADDGSHAMHKEPAIDKALQLLPVARAEWFRPAHHDVHAQKPVEVAELLHNAVTDSDFYRRTN